MDYSLTSWGPSLPPFSENHQRQAWKLKMETKISTH